MYRPGMTKLVFPEESTGRLPVLYLCLCLFDVLSAAAFDVVTTEPA